MTANDLIDPNKLGGYSQISDYMKVAKDLGHAAIPVVLSETSVVSCGGCKGLSNTFAHVLWFLDFVGRAWRQSVRAASAVPTGVVRARRLCSGRDDSHGQLCEGKP